MRTRPPRPSGTAAAALLCFLVSGCRGPAGSVAYIDPVMAYAAPAAARAFGDAVRDVVTLPESGASAALYASLDAGKPRLALLSPLLASEIDGILSRDDTTLVACLGDAAPRPDPRLYAAVFSSADAARLAGDLASARSAGRRDGEPGLVGAVFTDAGAADAFVEAYRSSGGPGAPVVELAPDGFSQAAADRLKALDVRVGYVSASPRDVERWVRQAFDPYAFVVAEYPLPPDRPVSSADGFVAWDVDGTLGTLIDAAAAGPGVNIGGKWKFIGFGSIDLP